MLSLSQLRQNLFSVFKTMKNTGMTFEIVYNGVVYDLEVKKTEKIPVYIRPKKVRSELMPHRIDIDECSACGYVLIASICMNTKCTQGNP